MSLLEFVVLGTPVSVHGSSEAKRFWQQRVAQAARRSNREWVPSPVDSLVLRVAYFYVYAPAADLDNILKPLQDALKDIAYVDDIQVVDLIASMRRKAMTDRIPATTMLLDALSGGSDFLYVAIDRSSTIEVFR